VVALTDPAAAPWVEEVMAPGADIASIEPGRAAWVVGDAGVVLTEAALIRATLSPQPPADDAACERRLRELLGLAARAPG
jgi:hypothetical protein